MHGLRSISRQLQVVPLSHASKASRRQFLAASAATAAASAVWSSTSPVARAAASNDRPIFATIGMRNQGWTITEKSTQFADFAALVDVDQTVLDDNVAKLTERQGKKPDGYNDYRKVLERDDIDAVMIATPDHWHTKIAVEAMLAGKDVYCEKPLTLTIDEGKLIEEVVQKTGRVFQVGTMQRTEFDSRFLKAIALVRQGRLGELKRVTCTIDSMVASEPLPAIEPPEGLDYETWLGPAPSANYRALPELREGYGGGVPLYSNCHYSFRHWYEYSGGKMADWGAHHVDIACWALGDGNDTATKVTPVSFTLPVPYENGWPTVDDRYNAATEFEISVAMSGGVEMVIRSQGGNGILFEGSKGRIMVNRGRLVGKPVEDLESYPLPEGVIEELYGGPVASNHTANWIEAMQSREQPISDVWSHNRMLEICHLSNIAMRLDRPLNWDAQTRQITGDEQANAFLSREYRKGYEIDM